MGAFQEERQVEAATPSPSTAAVVERTDRIPFYVEQAVRTSLYGRPGAVYLDMPDDVIPAEVDEDECRRAARRPDPPRTQADRRDMAAARSRCASRPSGRSSSSARAWRGRGPRTRCAGSSRRTGLPFLASPMGKGVVPDDHPLSVGAARSHALQNADLVVLLGARLNWIMHFGLPPRFRADVRVVQLDIAAEQMSTNVPAEVALVGDGKAVMAQLNAALAAEPWSYPAETPWRPASPPRSRRERSSIGAMAADDSVPMNYYRAFRDIREAIPRDAIIVSEGANTMDIGRTQLDNREPRHRLDAGTYGTMGVGFGFAVAAAVVQHGGPGGVGHGRLGVRLLRHGAGDDLPLRAADHHHRAQQRRHRRRLRGLAGRPAAAAVGACPAPPATRRSARRSGARATTSRTRPTCARRSTRRSRRASRPSSTCSRGEADRKPQEFHWKTWTTPARTPTLVKVLDTGAREATSMGAWTADAPRSARAAT